VAHLNNPVAVADREVDQAELVYSRSLTRMTESGILEVEPELGPERSRLLGFAERGETRAEVVHRSMRVGVVVAEDTSASGEGVFVEFPGSLMFAEPA
jgi:hypothetical protein